MWQFYVFLLINFIAVANCRQLSDNLRALLNGEVGDLNSGVTDNSLVQKEDIGAFTEAGIGRDFRAKDDYDASITKLLHSFQTDDKNGNVFHHGGDDPSNENGGLGTLGLCSRI